MKEIPDGILTEITNFCRECGSNMECPEMDCVLFRIEKQVEDLEKLINELGEHIIENQQYSYEYEQLVVPSEYLLYLLDLIEQDTKE